MSQIATVLFYVFSLLWQKKLKCCNQTTGSVFFSSTSHTILLLFQLVKALPSIYCFMVTISPGCLSDQVKTKASWPSHPPRWEASLTTGARSLTSPRNSCSLENCQSVAEWLRSLLHVFSGVRHPCSLGLSRS